MRGFFHFGAVIFLLTALLSCADGETIGGSVQPQKDIVSTDTATFRLSSQTVLVDSILQRNSSLLLGEFTDGNFGTTKAEVLTQLYCSPDFSFGSGTADEADSAFLYLFYDSWFGDSTSLFEVSVYQMNETFDLNRSYFTNIDPDDYCQRDILLGRATFTPVRSYNKWTSATKYCVRVNLDKSLGTKIIQDYKANPEHFKGSKAFNDCFKGLYLTTTYGNGSLLYLSQIELELCYGYQIQTDGQTVDTISATYFSMTPEVRTINTFQHPDLSSYMPVQETDSLNYLYAPAGMYTSITMPVSDITSRLSHKNINYARLMLSATGFSDESWGLNPPEKLLLIREEDVHDFFASFGTADDTYSFLASYDEGNDCFIFNLSSFIQKCIRQADGNLPESSDFQSYSKLLLLPVSQITNDDGTALYLTPEITPSAVKVRSGSHSSQPMKLEMVYSSQYSE